MLLLIGVGILLEREQGRGGIIDSLNEGVSAMVVRSVRSSMLPPQYHHVDLTREESVEVFADQADSSRDRVVYSGVA